MDLLVVCPDSTCLWFTASRVIDGPEVKSYGKDILEVIGQCESGVVDAADPRS